MKYLFILLSVLPSVIYGQAALFKEVRVTANPKFYKTSDTTIIYPIVITKDQKAAGLINTSIRNAIMDDYDTTKSLKKNLYQLTDEGTINLSYQVTFNKNGILSMNIYYERCGAYCSSTNTYFNFDLKTGEELNIKELLYESKLNEFTKMIQNDKTESLNNYKKEEKEHLDDKEIDSTTYNWSLEEVDSNCMNSLNIDQFVLSSDSLEIIDPCEFPHAIRSQEPSYQLKYSYKTISDFIKPGIKLLLLGK